MPQRAALRHDYRRTSPRLIEPQRPGRWVWDPATGARYWEPIILPPPYYVHPGRYAYWHVKPYPPGPWTFVPNPDFDKTIYGMLFLPQRPPDMAFKPGEGPQFPWLPREPAKEQNLVRPRGSGRLPPATRNR
ncbi:MAG: hypothetical protein JSV65_12075 [Armatimonadota bacterium]|nr:MAG: hypothetical protein JSV65_12075 [Armatimonadota bacterium]